MLKSQLLRLGKFCVYCCLAALIAFGLQRFCYRGTDGFALHKIVSALKPEPEWVLPPLSEEENSQLEALFNQPFYYLGKGAQAYVFSSQDGQAVIKFCRFDHLRPPLWFISSVFPFLHERERIEKIWNKRGRLEQEFGSYKIAFTELKKETGLIYLHLNKTTQLKKKITIYDKSRVAHELDLDKMEFIVQKKASLVYPTLSHLMEIGQEESAKKAVSGLVQLLAQRCSKGIFDKDPDIETNFGFLNEEPVQIDIGRFSWRTTAPSPIEIREEILRITGGFKEWLEKHYPTLSSYLVEEIMNKVPSCTKA